MRRRKQPYLTEGRMTKSRSSMKTGICTVTLGRGPCHGGGSLPLKVTEFSSTRLTLPNRHSTDRTMTRQGNTMMRSESGVMRMSTTKTALHCAGFCLTVGSFAALSLAGLALISDRIWSRVFLQGLFVPSVGLVGNAMMTAHQEVLLPRTARMVSLISAQSMMPRLRARDVMTTIMASTGLFLQKALDALFVHRHHARE